MKWFVNLKVKTKLVVSFLLIAVISAAIGIIGITQISAANGSSGMQASVIIIIALCLLNIVSAIVLSTYNAYLILDPMGKNERMLTRISVGNIDVIDLIRKQDEITIHYQDEIGSFSRVFSKAIKYLEALVLALEKIAQGDLSTQVPVVSDGDMLGNNLKDLVNNFHRLVEEIDRTTDQVESGAGLVADSSLALSQGATHQASSVQELTAALEEISSQTYLNAQNAEKANELTKSATSNASDGNAQMKEMLRAMEDISVSSSNISKIIKVIDDIAFQTNILALNAAVEAARAGQHGKGFAVVAEEVRSLAGKSANAAKETTDMIENSIRKVEAGTKIANSTAMALDEIVAQVDRAAEIISSIAVSSTEQAQGIEQIKLGITQVSQVIQTNAATAEESAAASDQLSGQARLLKESVGQFKLRDSAASRKRLGSPSENKLAASAISSYSHRSADFGTNKYGV